MRGFSEILRVFSKFNSVTADSSEVVGLNISLRYIFKPYSPHCINTAVSGHAKTGTNFKGNF